MNFIQWLFSIELSAGLLFALVFVMLVILILQIRSSTQVSKLTFPAYEYVIKRAEHEANAILSKAQKEAREIIAEAEKTGQKTFAEYTEKAHKANDSYVTSFENLTNDLKAHLSDSSKKAIEELESITALAKESLHGEQNAVTEAFNKALETVGKASNLLETRANEAIGEMKERMVKASESLEAKLKEEGETHQERISAHLDKLLKGADEHIASYEKARMALLDTHIERLIEDVTKRVLLKQLSVDDHASLARKALEEAKEHNLL